MLQPQRSACAKAPTMRVLVEAPFGRDRGAAALSARKLLSRLKSCSLRHSAPTPPVPGRHGQTHWSAAAVIPLWRSPGLSGPTRRQSLAAPNRSCRRAGSAPANARPANANGTARKPGRRFPARLTGAPATGPAHARLGRCAQRRGRCEAAAIGQCRQYLHIARPGAHPRSGSGI